jgi:hypothetical protein
MTAEQSPQVRGSLTGRAQLGHQSVAGAESCAGGGFTSGMQLKRSSDANASSTHLSSLAAGSPPARRMKRFVPDEIFNFLPTGYEIIVKPRWQSKSIPVIVAQFAWAEWRCATHVKLVTLYQPPLRLRKDHDRDIFVRILIGPIRMTNTQQQTFCNVPGTRRIRSSPLVGHDRVSFPTPWQRETESVLRIPVFNRRRPCRAGFRRKDRD